MPTTDTGKYRFLHTMIRVKDLDASLKFYTDELGMNLIRKRDYPTGKFTLAFVGYGDEERNTVVELTHNWDQAEPYALGSGFGHLAIGVPDVYATCERLAQAGVKIPRPAGPMAHGGSVIAFIEPRCRWSWGPADRQRRRWRKGTWRRRRHRPRRHRDRTILP
jgi:lactoylglutathione lyase